MQQSSCGSGRMYSVGLHHRESLFNFEGRLARGRYQQSPGRLPFLMICH
jgi:hypothetical protein